MCDNALMIRQDRLEEQLLSAIQQRILNPATFDVVVSQCEAELRHRLTKMQHQGLNLPPRQRQTVKTLFTAQ